MPIRRLDVVCLMHAFLESYNPRSRAIHEHNAVTRERGNADWDSRNSCWATVCRLPFFDSTNPKAWIAPFMGVPFVAYGVGGQRLLAKIAPSWAKKSDKDKP